MSTSLVREDIVECDTCKLLFKKEHGAIVTVHHSIGDSMINWYCPSHTKPYNVIRWGLTPAYWVRYYREGSFRCKEDGIFLETIEEVKDYKAQEQKNEEQ